MNYRSCDGETKKRLQKLKMKFLKVRREKDDKNGVKNKIEKKMKKME